MSRPGSPGSRAAFFVGVVVAFVVAVDGVRLVRPALLLDPDPAWLLPRVVLWLGLACAAVTAGALAAGGFLLWSRSWLTGVAPGPLPLSKRAVAALAAAAIVAGLVLRVVWLDRLPLPFIEDEVNLIGPTLDLTETWRDFSNSIRAIPFGRPDPHEVIGVLYLRLYRGVLDVFGPTVTAVRFPSLVGGALTLVTATLLGRALLPRGGGALAGLVLAGLRWHLILSRNGWHLILLAAIADIATLFLLLSRRRGRAAAAALAGLLMGIGAHFHFAAWVPIVALAGFALWPPVEREAARKRLTRTLAYGAGVFLAVAPLLLLREGRETPYFGRAGRHNVLLEMRRADSALPAFSVAADAIPAPWLLAEPAGWIDLPNRSRLGWIVGAPVALALLRSLVFPREELSGVLLLHAGAAFAATVASGQAGHPHGFRFGYLTTVTAVAAAAGILQLVRLAPPRLRRAAAVAAVGLVAVNGAAGARDALLRWPEHRATFDGYHGEDTLMGRAAARWEAYGTVGVESGLGRSDATIDTVRRYRLDPEAGEPVARGAPEAAPARRFRVVRPGTLAAPGERIVERVEDGWGREWAIVLARAAGRS